ncbi:MAG: hypothetical protein Q7R39_03585 [Dehalococcoidia bacterium]|nr:hypothetical protein [Dehalococcoidia bacterium]
MRTTALDVRIYGLETNYLIPGDEDRARIVSILGSNEQAVALLKEAPAILEAILGQEMELFLHLDRDPEDGFEEIFATVRTHHPPEAGIQLMAEFDHKWWLTRLPYVAGRLNFMWEPLQ